MYILIDKNTNKVAFIRDKKPISYTDNLILAEVETLPAVKYDYLIAKNIRDVIAEDGSVDHITCDLAAQSRLTPTQKQLDALKENKYNKRVTQLVRLKYNGSNEQLF